MNDVIGFVRQVTQDFLAPDYASTGQNGCPFGVELNAKIEAVDSKMDPVET